MPTPSEIKIALNIAMIHADGSCLAGLRLAIQKISELENQAIDEMAKEIA